MLSPPFVAVLSPDRTDRWWNRITVGDDTGDGVVPGSSQIYPDATFNVDAEDPVSHTAQADTRTSAAAFQDVLELYLDVLPTE